MQFILSLIGGLVLAGSMFASTLAIDSSVTTSIGTTDSTTLTTTSSGTSDTTALPKDGTTGTVATDPTTSLNTATTEPLRTATTNTLDHPAPLVAFSASLTSVTSGGSATLTWNSRNAASCSAGGAWRGIKPVSGTQVLTNLTASGIYELTCTGPGGSVSRNVGIRVMATTDTTAPVPFNTAEPIRTTVTKEFYYPDRPATTTPLPLRILPPRIASTTRMRVEEPLRARTLESAPASSSSVEARIPAAAPVTAADPGEIRRKMRALMDRTANDGMRDTDGDGITDYDEVRIYGTDPRNKDTNGDGVSDDGEVMLGRDPAQKSSSSAAMVTFEDPRRGGQIRTDLLVVAEVRREKKNAPSSPPVSASSTTSAVIATSTTPSSPLGDATEPISVHGKTAPNALVTVYIFSTPTIVVVKADKDGNWSYTLTKELPDGRHEVYAAITDNQGNIVAKSQPVSFVKQAAALTVTGELPSSDVQDPALFSSLTMMVFGVLMGFVLAALLLYFGQRYWKPDANTLYIGPDNNYGEDAVKQDAAGTKDPSRESKEDIVQ